MDIADSRWSTGGSSAACHTIHGEVYNFSDNFANKIWWEINRTLAVMDASSSWWQTTVSDEATVLVQNYSTSRNFSNF